MLLGVPLLAGTYAIVFTRMPLLGSMWRYASLPALVAAVKAAALTIGVFLPALFVIDRLASIPRIVPIIQLLLIAVLLTTLRLARRWWEERTSGSPSASFARNPACEPDATPCVLIGAGQEASILIERLHSQRRRDIQLLGILDFTPTHVGRHILSVPIIGVVDDLEGVLCDLARAGRPPKKIIVSAADGPHGLMRLSEQASRVGIPLYRARDHSAIPGVVGASTVELRPAVIEDLLGRVPVDLATAAVDGLIRGRRLLVTGAGGTIGSQLAREIARRSPDEIILLDASEYNLYSIDAELSREHPSVHRRLSLVDIRDRDRLKHVMFECQPDIVLHAAALKHVPLVENNPIEGVLTNVLGTRNVADLAWAAGVRAFVQVSTDKAVNPFSVMGATKRLGELYCQALDCWEAPVSRLGARQGIERPRFMTVRFGNVLGSSGSVIPLFQKQLAQGGPLTVTHPSIERYFMTVQEAAQLVLQAAALGIEAPEERGLIYVLDMGEAVRIYDLARQMIRLAHREPDEDIKIDIVGLRPGEKLFEELFDTTEEKLMSRHPRTFMARSTPMPLPVLRPLFDRLAESCHRGDIDTVLSLLDDHVPGFKRQSYLPSPLPRSNANVGAFSAA